MLLSFHLQRPLARSKSGIRCLPIRQIFSSRLGQKLYNTTPNHRVHDFTGLARLKEGEGGLAVRLLEESKAVAHDAIPLAAAYNKASPSTPAAEHAEFDNDLRICVESALSKVILVSK